MAKRFTDTGLYDKPWFMALKPHLKCLWEYILKKCDHAGVLDFNPDLASFQIGEKITWDDIKLFGGRVIRFEQSKIFIKTFIEFQYGALNENNNAHRSVLAILKKYNLLNEGEKLGASEPLMSPSQGAMDKDKDKDKDQDKDKDKVKDKEKSEVAQSATGAIELFSDSQIAVEFLKTVKHSVQEKWLLIYPDAQWVLSEIEKASTWCDANSNRSPKKNIARFVTNWLDRGWENYRKRPKTTTEYVKDLIANNPYRGENE